MVNGCGPQEYISYGSALGLEAPSCSHANDQVRLEPLTGQEGGQRCRHRANIVYAVFSIFAYSIPSLLKDLRDHSHMQQC